MAATVTVRGTVDKGTATLVRVDTDLRGERFLVSAQNVTHGDPFWSVAVWRDGWALIGHFYFQDGFRSDLTPAQVAEKAWHLFL